MLTTWKTRFMFGCNLNFAASFCNLLYEQVSTSIHKFNVDVKNFKYAL